MSWKHLAVMAINKSSTGSRTRAEIMDFIAREYPSFPLTDYILKRSIRGCPWFLNVGFKYLSVWTINPELRTEIEEEMEMEAIVRNIRKLQRLPTTQPATTFHLDPLNKSAHESIGELVAINTSHGCTIRELEEIATRFSGGLHLNCPELIDSPDRRIKIVDMSMSVHCYSISIDQSIMAQVYKQILKVSRKNAMKIKAAMENPEDFEALMRGDLKHGFDASPEDFDKLVDWIFTSREGKEEGKENQGPKRDFPYPPFSTDQLIALAYKNSCCGQLSVIQLYQFISKHFPVFSVPDAECYQKRAFYYYHLKVKFSGKMRLYCKIHWTWAFADDQLELSRSKPKEKGPSLLHVKHLIAIALLKSPTETMTKSELVDFIHHEFPGCPHPSVPLKQFKKLLWFVNVGFPHLSVWAVKPECRAEIESEIEAIYKEEQSSLLKYKAQPPVGQPPKPEMDLQSRVYFQAIREAVQGNANGCSVADLQEIGAKHREHIHQYWPEPVDPSTKIKITDFRAKQKIPVYSIDPAVQAEQHAKVMNWSRENEAEVKASMRNPQDFEALLRGDLKHGFDLCPDTRDLAQLIVWTVKREKRDEIRVGGYSCPPYSKSQLIVLAFQNSRHGRLTMGEILDFVNDHFRGHYFQSSKHAQFNESLNKLPVHVDYLQRMSSTWKPLDGSSAVAKVSEEEGGAFDENFNELEEPNESAVFTGSYWDTNMDDVLIDDSWTMESEDVYFKHEITIESEDPPEDSCFYGSEQPGKRRRVDYQEDSHQEWLSFRTFPKLRA